MREQRLLYHKEQCLDRAGRERDEQDAAQHRLGVAVEAEQAVGLHMVIVLLVDEHVRDADAERDIEDGQRRVQ